METSSPLEKTATLKFGTNKYQTYTLLKNWELFKLVPERQAYRGIAQIFPVVAQLIITKKSVAIPLLNSLIIQMEDRFSDEDRYARHFLYLVPSIIV